MGGSGEYARFAAMRETHVAVVFLLGDRAYKLKKPVDVGFLDFSTRERRLAACRREVDLNRRLAPDVYLGVADVSGPDGTPCDHLVVMRRLPDERRLATLVRAGAPVDDVVRGLARMLAAFHARARRGPEISAQGTRDALRARWVDSFSQVRSLRRSAAATAPAAAGSALVEEIEALALDFLDGREPLFAGRIADGRVVDGHGDVLADDIFCLDDGPRVLDCLEFDDHLRWLDGLDDIAFLAMDLEHLKAPELATRLLDWYAEFAADPAPSSLRHHYIAYRAFVRAKVAWVRSAQGEQHAAEEAEDYARLALRHLRAGAVRMVLVGGLPGTGKSTLSGLLADRLGMALLSTDRLRKEAAGLAPTDSAAAEYLGGIYTPAHTARTYADLLDRAEALLRRGESVVLDASWSRAAHRAMAAEVARRARGDLVALRCSAPSEISAARLRDRRGDVSDAGAAVAAAMAADTDTWPEAATVSTGASAECALEQALGVLDARAGGNRRESGLRMVHG